MSHDEKMAEVLSSEDRADKINRELEMAARKIQQLLDNETDNLRPYEIGLVVELFADAVNMLTDLDPDRLGENLMELRSLSNDAIGNILLSFPITEPMNDEIDRHLAVDVASIIGPDHAQNWYRFAVLVTKVA